MTVEMITEKLSKQIAEKIVAGSWIPWTTVEMMFPAERMDDSLEKAVEATYPHIFKTIEPMVNALCQVADWGCDCVQCPSCDPDAGMVALAALDPYRDRD